MKVLGIVGSPREGGNTEHLVRECLKTISAGGIEVELVTLHDKEIGPCDACGVCGEIKNECAIDDDFARAHDRLAVWNYYTGEYAAAWQHLHLAESYGQAVPAQLVQLLQSRMPDPELD